VGRAKTHTGYVLAVSVSADEKYVASGGMSEDRTIRVYDASNPSNESAVLKLQDPDDEVSALAFSPDGRYLVAGSVQGKLQVHQGSGSFEVIKYGNDWNQKEKITSIAFSSDGKYLVSGTSLGTLRVWEMEKFKLVWEKKKAHQQEINGVAISPTSFTLASAGFGEFRIWKPED
jgi:WD40 repeat protein